MKINKKIIYLILAVIIVGLLIYFVFIPQVRDTTLLWTKNSIKQDQVSSLGQEKSQLNNLKSEKKDAENLADALSAILPEKKDTGRFITDVEALAKNTNTNLGDIKFTPEKITTQTNSSSDDTGSKTKNSSVKAASTSTAKFKTLIVEMTVNGNYPDVINFLKGLEKINRAITLEKVDLSSVQNVIQASIKGKIYYKND